MRNVQKRSFCGKIFSTGLCKFSKFDNFPVIESAKLIFYGEAAPVDAIPKASSQTVLQDVDNRAMTFPPS